MDNTVFTRTFSLPPCNRDEILRYCGIKPGSDSGETETLKGVIKRLVEQACPKLSCKACYATFPVKTCENEVDVGFAKVISRDLAGHLSGCRFAVVFAATIGMEFDRLLARKSAVLPSEALVMQAIGAERIESLCDTFEREIVGNTNIIAQRFSPGYGDLPLEFQRDIFTALGCSKRIGLMLGESFIMSPSKSVTAIIGVGNDLQHI